MNFSLLNAWADRLRAVTEEAGRAILGVRARGFAVLAKNDASPVTEADHIAESMIATELEHFEPALPIVAEERVAADGPLDIAGESFWLVDALDGTKEFIRGGDDFTVNVALIWAGVPVLGLVHAPARGETYLGIAFGHERRAEVWRQGHAQTIAARKRPSKVVITGSKSHEVPEQMDAFLADYQVAEKQVIGSSLKFCLVAEGIADLYPRFGPTCEWDIAAGHAVLRAAGGRVHTFDGREMTYKKTNYLNGRFLAEGLS
jgi:3'(2'), 5'-bisphosphate nucleotidase